jgi:hypothetical protein
MNTDSPQEEVAQGILHTTDYCPLRGANSLDVITGKHDKGAALPLTQEIGCDGIGWNVNNAS